MFLAYNWFEMRRKKNAAFDRQDSAFDDLRDSSVTVCWNFSISQGTWTTKCVLMSFVRHHPGVSPFPRKAKLECVGLAGPEGRRGKTQKWRFHSHYLASVPQFMPLCKSASGIGILTGCSYDPPTLVSELLSVHVVICFFSDSNLVFLLVIPTFIWCFLLPFYLFSSGRDLHTLPAWHSRQSAWFSAHPPPFF